jgi:hypothetical protein
MLSTDQNCYAAPPATVATLPEESPPAEDDDHQEALVQLWLDQGNLDAADAEAELIVDLGRKLAARARIDRLRQESDAPPPDVAYRACKPLHSPNVNHQRAQSTAPPEPQTPMAEDVIANLKARKEVI